VVAWCDVAGPLSLASAYGNVLGRVLYPGWERVRGRPTFELLALLRHTERGSASELAALRDGLVRRLVRHAYDHTAHYRAAFDGAHVLPGDIAAVADLARLPVLDRETAQRTVDARTASWPPIAVTKATSGSTGHPLLVRFSAESRHWRDATRWRGYGWAGYHMGDKAVHLWGVAATQPTSAQRAKLAIDRVLRRDVYLDCMVRSDAALAHMVDMIRRERPNVIAGYAQAIADLARYVERTDARTWDDIPVIYGAERLWPVDRAVIERAFGAAVFETYGCREFMLMGMECEHHDGLHESAENLIVELLVRDPDRGRENHWRAAQPGEHGEVAITDLHNLANPFIRYLTGDSAVARAPRPCACGRTLATFGPVDGRVTDTMRDADGNPVEGILFNILFLSLAAHARHFQAVQRSDGRVTLRVVPAQPGALAPDAEALIRAFCATHLRGIPLDIEVVSAIPLGAAGKLRRVVVER